MFKTILPTAFVLVIAISGLSMGLEPPGHGDWSRDLVLDDLFGYSAMAGGFDQMLSQFGSYDSYATGSGYGGGHSRASQELTSGDYLGSRMVKDTSDDLLRVIREQEEQLDAYQKEFERLKTNAASAEGQQEAIQATNQFASMQVQLLGQIHALLMAQNSMLTTATQNRKNQEARDRMGSALQLGESEMFKLEREGTGMSFGFTD